MRYRWDEAGSRAGVVTLSAEGAPDTVVARTGDFWSRESAVEIDGEPWAFRVEQEGLIGAHDGRDRLGIERGRIWQSTWRTAGLDGELALSRTTSWLAGKLHFDLARDGERIAEVIPDGPWMYRPSLEAEGRIAHAEAVFMLWAAARIDARRPLRQIRPGGVVAGGGGAGMG